jgi:hypothetical protein
MPRSLSKEGVRDPLNLENSEFSHSLGQKRSFTQKFCIYKLYTLLAVQNHLVPTLF